MSKKCYPCPDTKCYLCPETIQAVMAKAIIYRFAVLRTPPSTPSRLNLWVDLSRFFRLAKRGDRNKHSNVGEIERKAKQKKIDEDAYKFNLDRVLGVFSK